ncbi:hypothetical protein [Nocardia arthritidis]|uniref:hypothetical protein n=1 Tax=Nocardia arthritidis TaxID=228602 RepID=UPI00157D6FFF|nr:hypothetical protein [Nocardia arthritidis]
MANHRLAAAAEPDFEPVDVLHQLKEATLVIEGSHEPAEPRHGAIIAERIPGARRMIVAAPRMCESLRNRCQTSEAVRPPSSM